MNIYYIFLSHIFVLPEADKNHSKLLSVQENVVKNSLEFFDK